MTENADPDAVRGQVARILSLDVDGRAFPAVGERDPMIGRVQPRQPHPYHASPADQGTNG